MTFNRFSEYVKLMVGCGILEHITMSVLTPWLGYPEIMWHPLPIALPLFILAMIGGWWLQFRTPIRVPEPEPVYVPCPTCGTRVDSKRIDTAPKEP